MNQPVFDLNDPRLQIDRRHERPLRLNVDERVDALHRLARTYEGIGLGVEPSTKV